MYDVITIKQTSKKTVDFIYQLKNVVTIIAVGSGSFGYKDELSDIDLSIVVDKKDNLLDTMKQVKVFIENNYDLLISMQENSDKRSL